MTILLVDDEPLMRLGLRMVLETYADMHVMEEAGDGQDAVRHVRELRPDVVLMDVRMPGMDGVEATRRIVASGSRSRVLILTTFDLDEYSYGALRAGASGFLLKNLPPADLVSAIRSVHSGDAVVAPSTTRRLLDAYAHRLPSPDTGERPTDPRLDRLTAREYETLLHLAEGLSNAEIAERLKLAEGTVKTHVVRILAKLELRDRIQAVVYAYEIGLVRATNRPPGPA
ncbi:response regulator transcription factor [Streptomyces sp. NPDC096057]|uniref:response regulator transcription factor n=1 Tax=Streptomyces sp. NPDC096057 TaxID=3155543 RepID=UPI003330D7FA